MPSASVAIAREPLLAGQVEWRAALERVAANAGFVLPAWAPSAPEAPLVWAQRNQLPDRLINAAAAHALGVPFHSEITNWPATAVKGRPQSSAVESF